MNHIDLIIRAARRIDATVAFEPDGAVQLYMDGDDRIGDFDDEDGAVEALLPLIRMRYQALTGGLDRLIDELAKAAGEPDAPGEPDTSEDAPDDWAGRVYEHENGTPIYIALLQTTSKSVISVEESGYRCAYLKSELDANWTRLTNHPMATDPPRDDGLGWREGDEYAWAFDDGCAVIRKLRDGAVVASYQLPPSPDCRAKTGGKYGQRLTFTPQWEAVTPDEPDDSLAVRVYLRKTRNGVFVADKPTEPAAKSPGQAAYDAYHGRAGIALPWYELPASLKDHWETASKAAIDAYVDAKTVSRRLTKARTEAYANGMRDMWERCCALLGVAADAGTSADPAGRDFYAGIGQAGNLVRAMRVTDEDDEREALAAAARAGWV